MSQPIDWQVWHDRYKTDPMLKQRLLVVQREISRVLDEFDDSPLRVVSMCAGEGRDLLGAVEGHRRRDLVGRLVELDPVLAERARGRAAALQLYDLEVRTGDAADTRMYEDVVPADLVLVCGVFGNISDADVEKTVRALPMFAARGATVIWTRHRREPDLTVDIRRWLAEIGFENTLYEPIPDPERQGSVGVAIYRGASQPLRHDHLFDFNRGAL